MKRITLEEEYSKKTGITPQDISKLREWLNHQPHLPSEHITDLDIILVYHSCQRSTEVSKQVLDLFYTLKTLFVNFFKDRCIDAKILKAADTILFTPLPTRTYEGHAVLYLHILDPDYRNFVYVDLVRSVLMLLDCWQFEEGTWPGFVIVIDMEQVSVAHLTRLDLQTLQQFFYFLQESMLVILKGFHFLNAPSFMDKVMMLIRPFMKKQLLDMVVIHEVNSKSFGKYFPLEGLPKESGGEYKNFLECKKETLDMLYRNEEFIRSENIKRVVESRRPGKPKTISDIFGGVEGSFKKLDND